jgi:hypothetical protein
LSECSLRLPLLAIIFSSLLTAFFQAESPTERKPRKSVAFSEGATIVDSDGNVTESADMTGGKTSAESHTAGDKEVDELNDMFKDLAKKKKKKSSKPKEGEEDGAAADGEFDPSALLKKKKKKSKKVCWRAESEWCVADNPRSTQTTLRRSLRRSLATRPTELRRTRRPRTRLSRVILSRARASGNTTRASP